MARKFDPSVRRHCLGTSGGMSTPRPRDLCIPEAAFGRSAGARWRGDTDGVDAALVAVARAQHEAALMAYRLRDRTLARRMATEFGFSVKTWSDHSLGKRWASRATWAAFTTIAMRTCAPPDETG
ncbi:hypothetical protein NOMA109596_01140 [Nocardioides marinus]